MCVGYNRVILWESMYILHNRKNRGIGVSYQSHSIIRLPLKVIFYKLFIWLALSAGAKTQHRIWPESNMECVHGHADIDITHSRWQYTKEHHSQNKTGELQEIGTLSFWSSWYQVWNIDTKPGGYSHNKANGDVSL